MQGRTAKEINYYGGFVMSYQLTKLDTQTLIGMSVDALKVHYEEIKVRYLDANTRDTRTQAYLMTVGSYIEKAEKEGEEN